MIVKVPMRATLGLAATMVVSCLAIEARAEKCIAARCTGQFAARWHIAKMFC